jgi:hypothetical protein
MFMDYYKQFHQSFRIIRLVILLLLSFSMPIIGQVNFDRLQQPGYYRMKLGEFGITAISDGTIPQDVEKLLTNTKPGEVRKQMHNSYQKTLMESSSNAYVIEYQDSLILLCHA